MKATRFTFDDNLGMRCRPIFYGRPM